MDWYKFINDVLLSQIRSYTLRPRPWSESGMEVCETLIEKIFHANRETLCMTFDHIDFYTHVYNSVSVKLQHILTHRYGRPLGARQKIACTCGADKSVLGNLSKLAFDVLFVHYEYRIILTRYNELIDVDSLKRGFVETTIEEDGTIEDITLLTSRLSLKRTRTISPSRKRIRICN